MIFQRGNPLDYERWAADPGMDEWDYAHCLPYFKRMETCLAGSDVWRGGDGPLVLERGPATSPLFRAFFEAVQQAGYPLTDDVNGYRQEGFAAFDRNIHRGRRLSAARAYLHPAMGRPNLEVRTRALVTKVLFDGQRAVGVEAWQRGQTRQFRADSLRGRGVHPPKRAPRLPRVVVPLGAGGVPLRGVRPQRTGLLGSGRSVVLRAACLGEDRRHLPAGAPGAALHLSLAGPGPP